MNKKQMQALGVIVLVIILGAIIWFFRTKSPANTVSTSDSQSTDQAAPSANAPEQQAADSHSAWSGTLKTSDNAAKGNLMLVTKNGVVYIHTSRDYSALLGKMVSVSYTGTINNFQLQNITAQ